MRELSISSEIRENNKKYVLLKKLVNDESL